MGLQRLAQRNLTWGAALPQSLHRDVHDAPVDVARLTRDGVPSNGINPGKHQDLGVSGETGDRNVNAFSRDTPSRHSEQNERANHGSHKTASSRLRLRTRTEVLSGLTMP